MKAEYGAGGGRALPGKGTLPGRERTAGKKILSVRERLAERERLSGREGWAERETLAGRESWAGKARLAAVLAALAMACGFAVPGHAASLPREDGGMEQEGGFWGEYYAPGQETGQETGQDQNSTVTYMPEDFDITYDGVLDQRTGEAPQAEEESGEEGNLVRMITQDMGFDSGSRQYVNYVRGDREKYYYSSLPKGIITNQAMSFQMGSRNQYALYCNGERVTEADVSNIVQEGAYVLETYGQGNSDAERFEFTIIQSRTNSLEQFAIPEGFRFTEVYLDEERVAVPSGTVCRMSSDGLYRFAFGCEEIGISYQVQVEKDTVAPMLEFVGVIDGIARGPVTVLREEEEAVVEVTRDGMAVNLPYTGILEEYGDYVVTIRDRAGNYSEYKFTIQMYFTTISMLVFILLIMIAAGLLGYYRYVKTHLRIR